VPDSRDNSLESEEASDSSVETIARRRSASPLLTIFLLVAVAVSGGVFLWALQSGSDDWLGHDDAKEADAWSQVQREIEESVDLYRESVRLKQTAEPEDYQAHLELVLESMAATLARADLLLEPVRDPVSGEMQPGYEAYLQELQPLVLRHRDLSKSLMFLPDSTQQSQQAPSEKTE